MVKLVPLISALSRGILKVAPNDPKAWCLQSVKHQDAFFSSWFTCKTFIGL